MPTEERSTSDEDKDKDKDDRDKKDKVADDPPIIVGGGGSTLIWIKKPITVAEIMLANVDPDAPRPVNPDNYLIFEVDFDVKKNHVKKNKNDAGTPHINFDKKTHRTDFE